MTMTTCKNGHRYDSSLTPECPECAMMKKGHTVPLKNTVATAGYSIAKRSADVQDYSGTADLKPEAPAGISYITPVRNNASSEVLIPTSGFGEYGSTQAVDRNGNYISRSALPIAGWLVCIEGPEKGKDYRLHYENNFIGRGARMDVCLSGDRTVSEDRHAVITYDSQERKFFFALSGGSSIVRLNGKAVLMTQEINNGDKLQIGQGTFQFVPFCGEQFQWD